MSKVLFLNLTAFTLTGGIEKFNKCFLKALREIRNEDGGNVAAFSAHDKEVDEKYFDTKDYKCFAGSRMPFVLQSIWAARKYDHIIIAHLNMAIIGKAVKMLFPKKKITVIVHGIEVMQPLTGYKKEVLNGADRVLTVSEFTKSKLMALQQTDNNKVRILNNTVDPYFPLPENFAINNDMRKRYGLKGTDKVMFTLTRMAHNEQYKGYDIVLQCLPELLQTYPDLKYVVSGKYDAQEKARVDEIIKQNGLEQVVTLTGFIDDSELIAHYQMADLFIMPSRGEGFGIVFIEAMACGLPVIAGNQDGSTEALRNGELGTLVNPESKEEIINAVTRFFSKPVLTEADKKDLQQRTLGHFGFNVYKARLKNILREISLN
jgi:glycosyltransferase involved in cell wall biosynthesis